MKSESQRSVKGEVLRSERSVGSQSSLAATWLPEEDRYWLGRRSPGRKPDQTVASWLGAPRGARSPFIVISLPSEPPRYGDSDSRSPRNSECARIRGRRREASCGFA